MYPSIWDDKRQKKTLISPLALWSSIIFNVSLIRIPGEITWTPPLDFRTKKNFDGHPNVYMHVLVHVHVLEAPWNLHVGLLYSTPLHHCRQPHNYSLRYVCLELFFQEHLRCSFVIDNDKLFCQQRSWWQLCMAVRSLNAFTSISIRGYFCWRFAWRVTNVCESTQHEWKNFPN